MSALGEAIRTIQSVLLLEQRIQHLERSTERVADDIRLLAGDLYAVDKRLVRVETMIEMSAGRSSQLGLSGA